MTEKNEDILTQAYDENPYTNRNFTNQWAIQNATKNSIPQRLRTDLGRSVGVAIVIRLVWLYWFTGTQPSNYPQKPCIQKDTLVLLKGKHYLSGGYQVCLQHWKRYYDAFSGSFSDRWEFSWLNALPLYFETYSVKPSLLIFLRLMKCPWLDVITI